MMPIILKYKKIITSIFFTLIEYLKLIIFKINKICKILINEENPGIANILSQGNRHTYINIDKFKSAITKQLRIAIYII